VNDQLRALLDLQKIDSQIDAVNAELKKIPEEIESERLAINDAKLMLEDKKKSFVQLKLEQKSLDIELSNKEEAIKKHNTELNMVKDNSMYRALLSEIEKAKIDKGMIEEKMLELMDLGDSLNKDNKIEEQKYKVEEAKINDRIAIFEKRVVELNTQLQQLSQQRPGYIEKIEPGIISKYEQIRKLKSFVIVPIEGDSCGGCRILLPAYMLNDVKKDKNIVFCENCSRILYYPE